MPKNTTQCPRPGLEPGALAPESSALTMRPPRLRGHLNLLEAKCSQPGSRYCSIKSASFSGKVPGMNPLSFRGDSGSTDAIRNPFNQFPGLVPG